MRTAARVASPGRSGRRATAAAVVAALSFVVAPSAVAQESPASCSGNLYAINSFAHNVSVIDTRTNRVRTTIPVGLFPAWGDFTPDRRQLYVTNSGEGSVSVIDVATNTVVRTIRTGLDPIGVAFTPDGKRLILSFIPGQIRIVTVATGESTPPISVGLDPEQIRITPDGRYVYATSTLQGIYKIDVDQARVVATIPIDDAKNGPLPLPYNLLMAPDGRKLYVANVFGNFISEVDTSTDKVVRNFAARGPVGLQLSPDRDRMYVTNFWDASVDEYDLASGRRLRTSGRTSIDLPSQAAESADGRYLYYGQSFDTKLQVFDTKTWKPVTTLTVGSGPNALAICDSASPR